MTNEVFESWKKLPPSLSDKTAGQQLNISENLLTELVTPTIWWYSAAKPALILGAAQKPSILDLAACEKAGIEVIKRTSGGALVLAEPEFLSLDITLPPDHPLIISDITESYRWLGECWLETLQRLGVEGARLVTVEEVRAERRARDNWNEQQRHEHKLASLVCFGTLSPYEVAVGNRKLVGLAQIRRRVGSLFQCGLPLHSQSNRIANLLVLSPADREILTEILSNRLTSFDQLFEGYVPNVADIISTFESVLSTEKKGINHHTPRGTGDPKTQRN